jgi:hypothetical protein
MAVPNLLAAIIVHWNIKHLGQAVTARNHANPDCPQQLLAQTSSLGWTHILLAGEYR